jgi:pimeloyl-ACP methyl ester carboxylesterase
VAALQVRVLAAEAAHVAAACRRQAHPIVVVGTRHDPATPYGGAVTMAASLGNAELLTWEGQGHAAVGRNDCINRHVADYLESLTVPPHNTRCAA